MASSGIRRLVTSVRERSSDGTNSTRWQLDPGVYQTGASPHSPKAVTRPRGWVPLAIASGVFLLMSTWHRGADLLNRHLMELGLPLERFLEEVERIKLHGAAQRPGDHRTLPPAGPRGSNRRHHVLPWPYAAHADRPGAHGAVAEAPVRRVMARHASSVPDFFSIPPTAW